MSWSLPGSWEYLSLNSLSCFLAWKWWNWKKCASYKFECVATDFSFICCCLQSSTGLCDTAGKYSIRFLPDTWEAWLFTTWLRHSCLQEMQVMCAWPDGKSECFVHLPCIRILLYDCSGRHASVRDVCSTSCGPGTGIKFDESLLLWQQSLQLWNPFPRFQEVTFKKAKCRWKTSENLQGRYSFPHLSCFPSFVYVFPLLSEMVFYFYLNFRCF